MKLKADIETMITETKRTINLNRRNNDTEGAAEMCGVLEALSWVLNDRGSGVRDIGWNTYEEFKRFYSKEVSADEQ